MTEPAWDAVVVGSGAGGAAATWGLCQRGLKVLLLEAGPRFDPARDYPLTSSEWDVREFPMTPASQGRVTFAPGQELGKEEPLLRSWNRVSGRLFPEAIRRMGVYSHVRALGGSTLHFTGESHRLHPAAFQMRSRFGVAADWPLSYADLEPYYCRVEELVGVAGPLDQGARWRSRPFPQAAHPLCWASQTLGRGAKALGLGWQANSRAALSAPMGDRPACNYCGACQKGCPRGDKGSADVTFIPAALASGRCQIRFGNPVVRIEAGRNDRIAAVLVGRADGTLERIVTPMLVLALGAVETPRLLLASDNLGNDSGQIGRNFMETVGVTVSALHPEPQHGRRGLPSDAICWDFNAPDAIPGVAGGCRLYNATGEVGVAGLWTHAQRAVPGWGRQHRHAMRQAFGHAVTVGAIGESLPNDGSHVTLDPQQRDAFGIPLARIAAGLEPAEVARLRFMAAKARELLAASGAAEIFESYSTWDFFNSSHVFGTCRMGGDAATSVVNRDCRSHRWLNLYVTDASVFPSSGGGEAPSLTIQALALHMVDNLRF